MKSLFPYSETTRGITVRVGVTFMPDQSEPARDRYFWSYHIRIENGGADTIQLISREWTITDGQGGRHMVQGEGVVGAQPIIEPGGTYDYVSGCPLPTPRGAMEGRYLMALAAGGGLAVAIPRFPLVAPTVHI